MFNQSISVSDDDIAFLKMIAKTLNHQVRLVWDKIPNRKSKEEVKVSAVVIVAEESCFVDYVKFELTRDRARRGAVHNALVAADTAQAA